MKWVVSGGMGCSGAQHPPAQMTVETKLGSDRVGLLTREKQVRRREMVTRR